MTRRKGGGESLRARLREGCESYWNTLLIRKTSYRHSGYTGGHTRGGGGEIYILIYDTKEHKRNEDRVRNSFFYNLMLRNYY